LWPIQALGKPKNVLAATGVPACRKHSKRRLAEVRGASWSCRFLVAPGSKTRQVIAMTAKAERIKSELAALTPQDRAELARFLIQSLDEKEDEDVQAVRDEELERRAAEIETGRVAGESIENMLRELRAKYS
jgi:putative addiction module component (TIGR02574 family)